MTKYFATIDGIRRAAKKLKRETDMPHHEALDRIARKAGFQNFVHATRTIKPGGTTAAAPSFVVHIHQYWSDRAARLRGTEKLTLALTQPLTELVKPHQFKGYLAGAEVRGHGDTLVSDGGGITSQDQARMWACRRARALQFMEATGLKPSSSHRAYPKSRWDNRQPGADHDYIWYDPSTKSHVVTDEPYSRSMYAAEREDWCEQYGHDIVHSPWGSIYGLGTELFLSAKRGTGLSADQIAARLARAPAAITVADWERYAST